MATNTEKIAAELFKKHQRFVMGALNKGVPVLTLQDFYNTEIVKILNDKDETHKKDIEAREKERIRIQEGFVRPLSNENQDLRQEIHSLKSSREKAERVVEIAKKAVIPFKEGGFTTNTNELSNLAEAIKEYDAALKDGEK